MLAHNQPIYCYNIESFDINKRYPLEYELPKTNKNKKYSDGNFIPKYKQQISLNAKLMRNLSDYFGDDSFNKNNYTNLNLSKIIYIIYKILINIDKNTDFYNELKNIFVKYNIILNEKKFEIENDLAQEISKINDKTYIIKIKENTAKSLEDYKQKYGSDAYGFVAYILNLVRIYSIPLCFLGIAIGAIHQYVIGIRKLDTLEKGMALIVSFVTILIICQILPLAFAVFVKFGWG